MGPIRVVTFNIRYGTAEDGDNSWHRRREAAIELIQDCAADLLCLQEALEVQVKAISEALPTHSYTGVARDDGATVGEFAPIFFSRRFQLMGSGTYWFSATPEVAGSKFPGCFHPRICTWAILRDGSAPFAVFNIHLDNEIAESRDAAVEQALSAMPDELPIVLAGDFNATEEQSCMEKLTAAGWREAFREARGLLEPGDTYHGFGASDAGGKIDYIWLNPDWKVLEADVVRVRPRGQWPSDHYALLAVLERNASGTATVESVGHSRL